VIAVDLILFVLLVAWFATGRALSDLQTLGRRVLAWGADQVAALAERRVDRSPKLAPLVTKLAKHSAAKLRNRPDPTQPRTSNGQQVAQGAFDGAGVLAVAGVGLVLVWVRIAVADAVGAARSASEPRATEADTRWAWVASWFAWARWPKPGEPHAPVYATATRTDRPAPEGTPALPVGTSTGDPTGFTTHWKASS
jgi:hypothetical protein